MDMIAEIVELVFNLYVVICVAVTTILLWVVVPNIRQLKRDVKQIIDEHNNYLEAENEVPEVPAGKLVKIESHGSQLYMFDASSDKFICQASTEEELWDTAKTRNPDHELMLVTQETIECGDHEVKITFLPGSFDDIKGSHEDIDNVKNVIRELIASGELFENAKHLDSDELNDDEKKVLEHLKNSINAQRKPNQ